MARLRVKALSRVQATLRNKLSRTTRVTRDILKEGAEDIADLAKQLVREDTGQLRDAISVGKVRDSRNRLEMVVYVDTSLPAAYRTSDGQIKYRDFNVGRYAEKMNTGRYGLRDRSRTKNRLYGGFRGVRKDRNRYVGDHFIVRAKEYYEPLIIKKMKIAIDEVL